MSKGRLERIIRESKGIIWNTETDEDLVTELDTSDFDWLIKQAERAQELEQKVRVDSYLFDKQVHQNKRYREAMQLVLSTLAIPYWKDMKEEMVNTLIEALESESE